MTLRAWTGTLALFGVLGIGAWAVEWIPDQKPPVRTPQAEPAESGEQIAWEESLEAALKRSRDENKPVMIEFYKTWEQWCKVLEERTLANKEVVDLSREFVCARIDAEKSESTVKRYGVKSYPTVIYLNPKGELAHRVLGFVPAEPFKAEMLKVAKGRMPEKEFQELVRSNPRDFRPLVMLGVGYLKRQEWDKAITAYERALQVDPGIEEKETHEVIYSLAVLYDYRKKPEKAERLLLDLLRTKNADKIKVHEMLGHLYLSLKRPEDAVRHFQAERGMVEDEKQRESIDRLIEHIRKQMEKRPASGRDSSFRR